MTHPEAPSLRKIGPHARQQSTMPNSSPGSGWVRQGAGASAMRRPYAPVSDAGDTDEARALSVRPPGHRRNERSLHRFRRTARLVSGRLGHWRPQTYGNRRFRLHDAHPSPRNRGGLASGPESQSETRSGYGRAKPEYTQARCGVWWRTRIGDSWRDSRLSLGLLWRTLIAKESNTASTSLRHQAPTLTVWTTTVTVRLWPTCINSFCCMA
jgi:hypothetical protein